MGGALPPSCQVLTGGPRGRSLNEHIKGLESAVRFELTPVTARGFADRGLKPLDYADIKTRPTRF